MAVSDRDRIDLQYSDMVGDVEAIVIRGKATNGSLAVHPNAAAA